MGKEKSDEKMALGVCSRTRGGGCRLQLWMTGCAGLWHLRTCLSDLGAVLWKGREVSRHGANSGVIELQWQQPLEVFKARQDGALGNLIWSLK